MLEILVVLYTNSAFGKHMGEMVVAGTLVVWVAKELALENLIQSMDFLRETRTETQEGGAVLSVVDLLESRCLLPVWFLVLDWLRCVWHLVAVALQGRLRVALHQMYLSR